MAAQAGFTSKKPLLDMLEEIYHATRQFKFFANELGVDKSLVTIAAEMDRVKIIVRYTLCLLSHLFIGCAHSPRPHSYLCFQGLMRGCCLLPEAGYRYLFKLFLIGLRLKNSCIIYFNHLWTNSSSDTGQSK